MQKLKEYISRMPYGVFRETIIKNVVSDKCFQKAFDKGPGSLTREEKKYFSNLIASNIRNEIKPPYSDEDMDGFMAVTIVRYLLHK